MNLDQHTLTARSKLHALRRPDATAIIFEDRHVTYAELHRDSNRTAHALLRERVRRGSRVCYLGKESDAYYDIALGCAKSGTVLVPINWRLTQREIDHILTDSNAEVLFVEREFEPVVDRMRDRIPHLRTVVTMDNEDGDTAGFQAWKQGCRDTDLDPGTGTDDPVAQMYTSGTTGLPKGVVLAHRTFFTFIANTTAAGVDAVDWLPSDRSLSGFPGLHAGGYAWFMHCFNVGAASVVMRSFVSEEAVRLIEKHEVTTVWAAPAMLQMLLTEPGVTETSFRSLRKIIYGGAPTPPDLMRRFLEGFGCELVQPYASAETGSFVTCLTPAEHRAGGPRLASAGRVLPGNAIKILDEDGEELPPGHVGRIAVWSPARFVEYYQRPDATAKMLVDGWLHTSDAGCLDEDGYLFLRDRIDDAVIVAGQNIYPGEVEDALRPHPAVADVAVFGVPHPRWGEVVRAAVVLEPGASTTARELRVFLRGRIADYKIPIGYSFVAELPRNPTGKVLRRVLRKEFEQQGA